MLFTLRTPEQEQFYQDQRKNVPENFCFLCERDLLRKEFKHWYICENRYPYTKISDKHDLLACKRHISNIDEMTREELQELDSIIFQIARRQIGNYDQVTWNIPDRQSNRFHFHLHLIKLKEK